MIVDNPASMTVASHEGREAVVIGIIARGIVEIQIVGMDRIGRRRIFTIDLEPMQPRMF